MRAVTAAIVVGLALAGSGFADEHEPLRAAEHELKIARDHLREGTHDYGGHRRAAIDHVSAALAELRKALQTTKGGAPSKPRRPALDDLD